MKAKGWIPVLPLPLQGFFYFMQVNTKFNIGQVVYWVEERSLVFGPVTQMSIEIHDDEGHQVYVNVLVGDVRRNQDYFFADEPAAREYLSKFPIEEYHPIPF